MRKRILLSVCSCLFVAGLSNSLLTATQEQALIRAKTLLREGVDEWDERTMLDARMAFAELLSTEDEMKWLVHYYIGYADFRLTTYYRMEDRRELQLKHLDGAIEHFNASLNLNEGFAESRALLAFLLGQKARLDPAQMATLGMEAQDAISEARAFGGENPRVAMISGILYFFTPEQFGGSKTKAIEEIKRSISLFETEKSDGKTLPDWGHDDALTSLARLYLEQKEFELAKQSVEEALRVNPRNRSAMRVRLQLEERKEQR